MRGFLSWLDYLASEGPSGVVKTMVGLISSAALFVAILGDLAVRACALLVVLLGAVALGLMLLADRRSLRRRIEQADRLVIRYVKFIQAMEPGYRITSWEKTVFVASNGDALDVVKVRARVVRPDVQFFWLWFGCGWLQPTRYRNKVDVRVRNLLVGDLPGVSLERTLSWVHDGRFAVAVHLHRPPSVGSEICIKLEVKWPGKCVPLMRGLHDSFTMSFDTSVQHARYKLVLPKGCDTYCETLGFHDGEAGIEVGSEVERGHLTYRVEARDLHPGRRVGLRMELRRRASAPVAVH